MPGLEVENGIAAVREPLDAVGTADQAEDALAGRDRQLALDLDLGRRDLAAALALEIGEPGRDPLIARPPEGVGLRIIVERREMDAADANEFRVGILGQPIGMDLGEFADCGVDGAAAIGGTGRLVDSVELRQREDVLGIDGVGVAQPVLDLGDRETRGTGRGGARGWSRLRPRRR